MKPNSVQQQAQTDSAAGLHDALESRKSAYRVRDAIGFLTAAIAGDAATCKIARFEFKITEEHRIWLNSHHVGVVWNEDGDLSCDDLADDLLSRILEKV